MLLHASHDMLFVPIANAGLKTSIADGEHVSNQSQLSSGLWCSSIDSKQQGGCTRASLPLAKTNCN